MSDERTTERLLEVIEELATHLCDPPQHPTGVAAVGLIEAITELRRRGDTLVRRKDLMTLWMGYGDDCPDSPDGFYERMTREYGL